MAIRLAIDEKPAGAVPVEIGDGVLWFRLPLPMALDHVNVYAIREPAGWTIVDTGLMNDTTIGIWDQILKGPLASLPIVNLVVTHHHPDHVGLAGWFKLVHGTKVYATQIAWLTARMLTLDVQARPVPESIKFYRRAGLDTGELEKRAQQRPFNFADCVHQIPLGFSRLSEGDIVTFGGHHWEVRLGYGHAPAHATLWRTDSRVVIGGDQFLADITPNIGVHPTEPDADPMEEWLLSCKRFLKDADDDMLVLPGHKAPFLGLRTRVGEYIEFHDESLLKLTSFLATPRRATECFELLFGRRIPEREFGLAVAEAIANLNHLYKRGIIARTLTIDGAYEWSVIQPGRS